MPSTAIVKTFAESIGANERDARKLISVANAAARAGEREANTGRSADAAIKVAETFAAFLGLKTVWPGLYPAFITKDGRHVHLPD